MLLRVENMTVPQFHIRLHAQQILEPNSPWPTRRGLEHEAAELGVEHRRAILAFGVTPVDIRNSAALLNQVVVGRESSKNVRLPQAQPDLARGLVNTHDEVLDLVTP